MSIYSIVLSGANPLGNLLAGPAADHFGEPVILRIQGVAMLTVAALVLGLRWLRRESRQQEDLTGQPTPDPD